MTQLSDALAVLRNRTDLIGSEDPSQSANIDAIWHAIAMLADAIESVQHPKVDTTARADVHDALPGGGGRLRPEGPTNVEGA